MSIGMGILLPPGPTKHMTHPWLADYDRYLPQLEGLVQSLWMSDHLMWGDAPTYEAWTVMSYLAARYPAFDIGSSVLGQSYRNPAMLAKMGATLQDLSGGRFILGLGAGWKEDEYRSYGFPFPTPKVRLEELADALEIIHRLWRDAGKVTYQGKHYVIVDAYCEPKPQSIPPIMVGGGGNKTMQLASQYADWWNLSDVDLITYSEKMTTLKGFCEDRGRDFSSLRLTWLGRMVLGTDEADARDRGIREGMHHYNGWSLDKAFLGTPEQVIERIHSYAAIGISYFIFEVVGLPEVADMARDVFAAIKG